MEMLKRHGVGEGESELGADFTSLFLPRLVNARCQARRRAHLRRLSDSWRSEQTLDSYRPRSVCATSKLRHIPNPLGQSNRNGQQDPVTCCARREGSYLPTFIGKRADICRLLVDVPC